jgi:hypothetical protein
MALSVRYGGVAIASALAAIMLFPATGHAVQPLTITNVSNVGDGTNITVKAPRQWKILNPRDCLARGVAEGGFVRQGYFNFRTSDRAIHMSFDEVVHRPLSARCPDLRKTWTTVERRKVWERRYKSRDGDDTSSRSTTGNCQFRSWGRELTYDCWGGRQASGIYHFSLPSDARDVNTSTRGSFGCCSQGSVSRRWYRAGNDMKYSVQVTRWRSYTVRWAEVSFLTETIERYRKRHTKHAKGYGELR